MSAPGGTPARASGERAWPAAGRRRGPGADGPADGLQNIATALTDVSERVAVLVREEVELAKAEVTEKASRLARGAVVGGRSRACSSSPRCSSC